MSVVVKVAGTANITQSEFKNMLSFSYRVVKNKDVTFFSCWESLLQRESDINTWTNPFKEAHGLWTPILKLFKAELRTVEWLLQQGYLLLIISYVATEVSEFMKET